MSKDKKAAPEHNKWAELAEKEETGDEGGGEGEGTPALTLLSREELEAQLTAAEAKASDSWEKILRCQADLDNQRRRHERDLAQSHKYAMEKFAREMVNVQDNLERSLEQKASTDINALCAGIDLTAKLLKSTLEKFAVKPIEPEMGAVFDPALHQAMTVQESADVAPGAVLAVLQKGYLLHDRLLRPALVVVAKAAEKGD